MMNSKDKEKNFKSIRKQKIYYVVTYYNTDTKMTGDVSTETMEARRKWHNLYITERKILST